jgi:hypothetical protein
LLDGFGEGQLPRADRSFALKTAADSFGSVADRHERLLTGTRFIWLWRAEAAQR